MTEVSVPNCPSKMHPTGPVALATDKPPAPPHRLRWRSVASAAALVAALAVPASQAWAVALGRVTVQSQLGEPLRAEIDLPQLSAQDAATLQASVAAPERFQALNLSFNPALADLRFQLVTLPDGRSVLRLSSTAAINEPFLDLLVQANWANGQLLRGYTLLFDPPNLRPAQAPVPQPPVAAVPPPVAPAAAPAAPPAPWVTQVRPAVPLPPAVPAAPAPAPPRAQAPAADPTPASVTVRRGDTAGRIAQAHLPAGVSLDQMLVALLQANPQAFIGDNVNRLRAGAVLDLPSAEAASATPAPEARRIVQAHSRDFNEFRRRLAALAPAQAAPEATRAAAGAVQAEVTDPRPAATGARPPDARARRLARSRCRPVGASAATAGHAAANHRSRAQSARARAPAPGCASACSSACSGPCCGGPRRRRASCSRSPRGSHTRRTGPRGPGTGRTACSSSPSTRPPSPCCPTSAPTGRSGCAWFASDPHRPPLGAARSGRCRSLAVAGAAGRAHPQPPAARSSRLGRPGRSAIGTRERCAGRCTHRCTSDLDDVLAQPARCRWRRRCRG